MTWQISIQMLVGICLLTNINGIPRRTMMSRNFPRPIVFTLDNKPHVAAIMKQTGYKLTMVSRPTAISDRSVVIHNFHPDVMVFKPMSLIDPKCYISPRTVNDLNRKDVILVKKINTMGVYRGPYTVAMETVGGKLTLDQVRLLAGNGVISLCRRSNVYLVRPMDNSLGLTYRGTTRLPPNVALVVIKDKSTLKHVNPLPAAHGQLNSKKRTGDRV